MKLLFVGPFIGAFGAGLGGGVELTLQSIAQAMLDRGHQVCIVLPEGSSEFGQALRTKEGSQKAQLQLIEIAGRSQISAQTLNRTDPIILPAASGLARMWDYVRSVQADFDLILNFAYDWLPLYLTPFFQVPVAHLISMGSLSDAMDEAIARVIHQFPKTIGVHSLAQAATFSFADECIVLGNGFDLSVYDFCAEPKNQLAWVGRIAPEKGLEDAVAAAKLTGIPLKIMGLMQHEDYWQQITQTYPDAPIEYVGFLSTAELQAQLRQCRAILITPRWVEAFGNVAIEALACGVPAIAYRRGGPAEIVEDGKTGFLVEPDSVSGLVEAIAQLDTINRQNCRRRAEAEYSLTALGDRIEQWFDLILKG